ncbi:contact-dependent growth inhibition system immunity protein [Flavobacterium olei]|uniref:contact-dependent growth inhibition system immunity protein n=1 Tax=Flavobacterium olei TaxID=1886782 RepID=UPI003219C35B
MLKRAGITIKKEEQKYIINPIHSIKGGGGYASQPYIKEYKLSLDQLLNLILKILDLSMENTERPTDFKALQKEYLNSMGVKTMKALHDGSIYLSANIKDNVITFTPWENKGAKEGFRGFKEDKSVQLSLNSSEEKLIEALETAIARCR